MQTFRDSEPDFYTEYFDARKIVDLMRHTAIEGNVTNSEGDDLRKVKITFKGKDKVTGEEKLVYEEMSSKDGNFIKRELNPEFGWDVTFELPTYTPKTFASIDLKAGEHEKLEVKLEKIV